MNKLYLVIVLLIISIGVNAQFTNDSTANSIVRDSLSTEQLTPLSATTTAGATYISWFDSYNSNYELRMQLLDVYGNKMWPDSGLVVSSFPQSTALFRYDLKVDNEDNAIVAFQDMRSGNLNIVTYKIDPGANFIWSNSGIALNDSSAEGLSPMIGITASNNVIIAWNANQGSSKWISFQKISAGGSILWSKRIFDNSNTRKYSRAVMAPSEIDNIVMMYVEELGNFPGVTSTLFSQQFDINGDPVWTNPIQVSTKTIPYFIFPQVISDESDGFFTAFNTSNPVNTSLNDVYAQHVDFNGNLWSATGTQVANSSSEHKSTGGFCYNAFQNKFYINIQVLDAGQSNSGVFLQAIDSAGAVLFGANAIQLKNIDPIYYNPHALVDAGDGLISVFSFGSFGNQNISSIKTDYSGTLSWGYEPMVCNYNSNKDDLSAGLFKNNQTVIVWEDDRLDAGVYCQNLTGDGTFGIITSIKKIDITTTLQIFPNPASAAKLKFNLDQTETVRIQITNIDGKVCRNIDLKGLSGMNEASLNLVELTSGIYFVNLYTSEGIQRVKWLKI